MKLLVLVLAIKFVACVILECEFPPQNFLYGCKVKSLEITSRHNRSITEVRGQHLGGKSHNGVQKLKASGKLINYFPQNLTSFFKNLKFIEIYNADLREVARDDLQQFGENLREVSLSNNKIEVIEADLFEATPNIEKINLANNKIGFIEVGAFGNLTKLREFSVANNPCTGGSDYAWSSRDNVVALVERVEESCKDSNYTFRDEVEGRKYAERNLNLNTESSLK